MRSVGSNGELRADEEKTTQAVEQKEAVENPHEEAVGIEPDAKSEVRIDLDQTVSAEKTMRAVTGKNGMDYTDSELANSIKT